MITARSRKNTVPRTESAFASRSSWAVSSRPVASGTGRVPTLEHIDRGAPFGGVRAYYLLGADGAVTLAPAEILTFLDLLAQAEDAVHERLRAWRAPGDVDVDGHELVSRHERVIVED